MAKGKLRRIFRDHDVECRTHRVGWVVLIVTTTAAAVTVLVVADRITKHTKSWW